MTVYEKLLAVQSELKAPKSQYNSFGKYNYRNVEDILEAVKPLCEKQKALIYLSDKVVYTEGRFYIQAEANFLDAETGEKITVTGYAREDDSKKGMDGAQITGASSSYARKYALGGLLDVDDGKDSDSLPPNDKDTDKSRNSSQQSAVKPLVCSICGKPIRDAKNGAGEIWKSADIAVYTERTFGKRLCISCMNKENQA